MSSYQNDNSTYLLQKRNEDDDLKPQQLSGDENGEQSIFASSIGTSKANFMLTAITIVKTIIGSSILIVPYTINQLGYFFGTIIFLSALAINQFGTLLLLKAKNLSGHSNYATIFFSIWNSNLSRAIGFLLIFLNNVGFCIAETIVFKSSLRKIFQDTITNPKVLDSFYTQPYFMALIFAAIEIPFVMVSKMEKLKFTALLGVIGIVVFLVVFIIIYIVAVADSNPDNNPVGNMRTFPDNWLLAFANIPNSILALSYQMNFFPIFKGMKNVNDKRMVQSVFVALLFCMFCYLLVGILGYHYVGDGIEANFLQSLTYNKISPTFFFIVNFSFILCLVFAFPFMFFGCRNNFIALIKMFLYKQTPTRKKGVDQIEDISSYMVGQDEAHKKRKAKLWFIVYTMIIYAITMAVALTVDSIEVVFNAIGAICSTSISIILPCVFYIRLVIDAKKGKGWKYYLALVLTCLIAPYSIFSIIALYVGVSE